MKMQIIESMLFYSNGFEKTECVGKKLKNIAPNFAFINLDKQTAIRLAKELRRQIALLEV